jgi:phosphatidylserine decarboxylase
MLTGKERERLPQAVEPPQNEPPKPKATPKQLDRIGWTTPSEHLMQSLSLHDRIGRILWRLLPKRALSRIMGSIWSIPLPRIVRVPVLSVFAKAFHVDSSEAEQPLREYRSIHDFFVRRLKPGTRPVQTEANVVCCPADGRVVEAGYATAGKMMNVKGRGFSLTDLLADSETARALVGGPYLIVYLSPRDYHRVHAPATGSIIAWHHVPGCLFSVNEANLRREAGLFARNERLVTIIDGDEVGLCACVMVAAFGVGNITVGYDAEVETHRSHFSDGSVRRKHFASPLRVHKGDELGIFHLGSTVIVVFAPGQVELSPMRSGEPVRIGQAIGQALRGHPDHAVAAFPCT